MIQGSFTTTRPCLNRRAPQATVRTNSVVCHAKKSEKAISFLDKAGLSIAAAAAITLASWAPLVDLTPPAQAQLTVGVSPIKNASAILRNALPIENKPIRSIQKQLEGISESLRIPGAKLAPVKRAIENAQDTLKKEQKAIIADFAPARKEDGIVNIGRLEKALVEFQVMTDAGDKQNVPIKQREALTYVGNIEEDMVKEFPFQIPSEYSERPLLMGRATLEALVHLSETPQGPADAVLTIVLDGYNAPLSSGNFLDLVMRKFYDNMDIQRSDGFVVQTGKPEGDEDGFVDPKTGKVRRVPMEVRVAKDKVPIYEETLEDVGRFTEQPVLPFNAYGTLAMARGEFENNSASSQVFFLLKESELTPSGANLLDGRYSVFGYVTNGQDNLGNMKVGDKIEYIKVISGAENLKNGP